jgi:hypothetical protein
MDLYYFTFHVLGCGFSFWRVGGIAPLVFTAFFLSEFTKEPICYEKYLIEYDDEKEEL